jgi:hypothetical protein
LGISEGVRDAAGEWRLESCDAGSEWPLELSGTGGAEREWRLGAVGGGRVEGAGGGWRVEVGGGMNRINSSLGILLLGLMCSLSFIVIRYASSLGQKSKKIRN